MVSRALARQHHLTLNTLVQGAWAVLLSRYSGEDDVVFGGTVSGRPTDLSGVEAMVGLFINTLPMRVQMSGDTSLLPCLQRLQAEQVERERYAYSPLVEIHSWSEIPRGMALFESIVVFENYPLDTSLRQRIDNVEISGIRVIERTHYPLTVIVMPGPELALKIIYDTRRLEASSIVRLAGHLQILLGEMVANPHRRVSEMPLLTEAERCQLLVEWNDTKKDFPQGQCLHGLFEAQVNSTPDAVAVVYEDKRLTYRQLNRQANQLAHHLQKLGVGPEVLVGICVERSLEMVVGMLAILKAGGAYVPLDPAYPRDRLAFMLEDTRAPVLLTQRGLKKKFGGHGIQIVCLEASWEAMAREPADNPVSGVRADNLAYVIYTSGSTGKPKGVAIEHHSPVNLLYWAREIFPQEDLAGVLASTSICFDLSIFELFVPLSWGGKVILADSMLHRTAWSAAREITLINTVPSAIAEILRVDSVPASVRTINLAGELLKNSVVQQIYQHSTIQRVLDLYGPSECTTYSAFALRRSHGPATIGRPITNTQIYLLDRDFHPVPVGVPGELYIGGDGLARGYLNRPELTEEKFIPDPFSKEPGARLYRTGDLARYFPDGNIEFLGRIDHR